MGFSLAALGFRRQQWIKRASRLFALPTICIALGATSATAAAPRAPTGKWVVDYNRQCLATRDYGSPQEPLFLAFKPSPQGQSMQVIVARKGRRTDYAVEVPAVIGIDENPPLKSGLLAFTAGNALRTLLITLPSESFAPMRKAARVSITAKGEIDETFTLSQVPALMTALDRCRVDLAHFWHIDDAGKASLRSQAAGNLARFLSDGDYPDAANRGSEAGIVQFELLIDEKGKVADCMVTETSSVPLLDAQSCAILTERARFTPAVGADGKPARDAVVGRIRWKMNH
jgi:hypothetical protein